MEKKELLLKKDKFNIYDLIDVVEVLRGEGGCPWDREQTHESIRNDMIEETYEVIEAIDNKDVSLLREELGDLLFQVIFHAQIEREKGTLELDDIITEVCAKMIHRHPHVFGDITVKNTGEVLSNWENIKTEEKQRITLQDKLRAIPPMLPALMRAQKVAKKSGTYEKPSQEDIISQMKEILDGIQGGTSDQMGQLLFLATALSYKLGVSAEQALYETTNQLIDSL